MQTGSTALSRAPRPSSLADVLDLILDKGLVVDAYVRVSLAGIELLTIDARIVVASVDTYLRFAEAVNRLDLGETEERGLPALFGRRDAQGDGDGDGQRERGVERRRSDRDGRGEGGRAARRRAPDDGQEHRPRLREHSRDSGDGRGTGDPSGLLERITERARR